MIGKIISILLMIVLCASFCVIAEEDIAVRVGSMKFDRETVRREADALVSALEAADGIADEESVRAGIDEIVQEHVSRGIAEMMLKDAGAWELDENTQYALRETAQQQYESYWQYFRNLSELSVLDDLGITKYMSDAGITSDLVYDETVFNYRCSKLLAMNGIETQLTEADVEAYYTENIVLPFRERYENDIPLFEEEVLYAEQANMVYAPEGYRQILFMPFRIPADIEAELTECAKSAQECLNTAQAAYQMIAAMAMNGEDVTEQTEIYRTAMADYDQKEVEYGRIREAILPALRDTTDEVYARMLSGESFEDILGGAGITDALLWHADSERWPQEISEAAAKLSEIGDISQPVLSDSGVYILYYYGDMPGGAVEPDEDSMKTIRVLAEEAQFNKKLAELTGAHREDYDIEINLSGIGYGY